MPKFHSPSSRLSEGRSNGRTNTSKSMASLVAKSQRHGFLVCQFGPSVMVLISLIRTALA